MERFFTLRKLVDQKKKEMGVTNNKKTKKNKTTDQTQKTETKSSESTPSLSTPVSSISSAPPS